MCTKYSGNIECLSEPACGSRKASWRSWYLSWTLKNSGSCIWENELAFPSFAPCLGFFVLKPCFISKGYIPVELANSLKIRWNSEFRDQWKSTYSQRFGGSSSPDSAHPHVCLLLGMLSHSPDLDFLISLVVPWLQTIVLHLISAFHYVVSFHSRIV